MMKKWVANDYPGTKLAITEYNWGGQEHINGALAQADILGIFGREGLDIGTLWGPPDPATQIPGLMAFEVFRNYDGAGATFGDQAITSTSADQGKLSVYGALRTKDNMLTLVVINKTYGDFTTTLSLANFTRQRSCAGVPLQQRQSQRHRCPAQRHRHRTSRRKHNQHSQHHLSGSVHHHPGYSKGLKQFTPKWPAVQGRPFWCLDEKDPGFLEDVVLIQNEIARTRPRRCLSFKREFC